jgi:iron complex transport system permease protein
LALALSALAAALAFGLALLVGRYPTPGLLDPGLLGIDELARAIVLGVRLPRALAALGLGSALAAAGWTFQTVFANPVVEPGFLGVSQGAALGAALALVSGAVDPSLVSLSAFAFALLGLASSAALARAFRYGGWAIRLMLSGIAVSALLSSALSFVKYAADPIRELPDIVFWTMGSLAGVTWDRLMPALPVAALAVALLVAMRWRIMLVSLDDGAARSLTGNPRLARGVALLLAAAAVAAMTSICGAVGWLGLAAPHLARGMTGAEGRASLPVAVALGAALSLACDTLARSLLPGELPLGIPAAVAGTACFIALFATGRARAKA